MQSREWCVRVPIVLAMTMFGLELPLLAAQHATVPLSPPGVRQLTLEQARELALANNKLLEAGRLNLGAAELATTAAKKDYLPQVLGSAAYLHFNENLGTVLATRGRELGGATLGPRGRIQLPTITTPGRTVSANFLNQDSSYGALFVAQPITKLIGVSALVDLARADAGIAAAQLDKGTRELLSGVTQAYYGLLAAGRIKDALSLQARMLEPALKEKPPVELQLASLDLRKGLVETDSKIAELTDLMNQLLGLPACTRLELVEPGLPPVPITCVEEAAQQALNNNPQVREAQENITKAQAGLKVAKMDFLPDVNIAGGYITQSAADYIPQDFSVVGVTAGMKFFQWGKRKDVLRQRKTQIAAAAKNVDAVSETVQLEARKSYLAFKQAEQELQFAKELVKLRQDAEKGIKQMPELMTAKGATAKAQLDLMQAELNYRLAHAKLLAAIGQP